MRFLSSIAVDLFWVAGSDSGGVVLNRRLVVANRDCKGHARTLPAIRTLDPNMAAVSFNDPFGNRQTHAKAGSAALAQRSIGHLKEPFKDTLTQIQRNARSLILHGNLHCLV